MNEALKVDDKNPNALSLLGELELKNDDWVKAKETFRAANDATDGKDSYAILSLVYIFISISLMRFRINKNHHIKFLLGCSKYIA